MKESGKNMWSDNLPLHSPPMDSWEKIEASLDKELAGDRYHQQLDGLPEHKPPISLWSLIEEQLTRRRNLRIGYFTASIAATLLLAFILHGLLIPEGRKNVTSVSTVTLKMKKNVTIRKISKDDGGIEYSIVKKNFSKHQNSQVITVNTINAGITMNSEFFPTARKFIHISKLMMKPVTPGNAIASTVLPVVSTANVSQSYDNSDTLRTRLLTGYADNTAPPSPPLPKIVYPSKGFSFGLDYLPEPISNPEKGTSLYQSFGLLAQYQAPAIEIRSGIGISYYSIPADFSAKYFSFSNTASGYDTIVNNGDTICGLIDGIGGINIYGREESRFLNYSLGAGKRIFTNKKLSATFQVGAGFSLLLSKSNNLQGSTYDALRNKANTYINNIESNIPEINRSRFNLLTGFDFDYLLLRKWSISLEPTLKYYLDPIYKGRNTKSFSTGLRTGILFKL